MVQLTRTEAIKKFLELATHPDLAGLYNHDMECQVNVAQDHGHRIEGEYQGRRWNGYTDDTEVNGHAYIWKSFRIPYKASSEPEYTDVAMSFALDRHAEGIGMTGWDWGSRVSRWVAYDFDAITGHSDAHSKKLTREQLDQIVQSTASIPWVTTRYSTSGNGVHLYVLLPNVPTANHTEHAALARAILGQMSAITGVDYNSKVDNCGGNMWVWHRKMKGTKGLQVIKQGGVLDEIPPNWRDHIKVLKGHKRRNLPQSVPDGEVDTFAALTGQRPHVQLEEEHKKVIEHLRGEKVTWWWDQDQHMLVTHTFALKQAHEKLGLRGYFDTSATGREQGDYNCFCFPLRKGGWVVRRFTPGVQEHSSWEQDGAGWTRTYLNREPDLQTACRAYGGVEDEKGGFNFREAESAIAAARLLGVNITVAPNLVKRHTRVHQHKDGRLVVEVDRQEEDTADSMQGWLVKKNKPWTRIYSAAINSNQDPEISNFDDTVRHLITQSGEDFGWMLKDDRGWRMEPLMHIKLMLQSQGLTAAEVTDSLGALVNKCWRLVNKPFQPEYPGNREWNRDAPQLAFKPSGKDAEQRVFTTWNEILTHCGQSLDDAVLENEWCKQNGIIKGSEYLKCWIASLFQHPSEPLPYLFFYGPQDSGKSILHEALSLLLTKGYKRADAALVSQGGFNAELEGALLCVIEEVDLRQNKSAYNRIKDWVTGRDILIHVKGQTPYQVANTTHWIQCANDHNYCPIFAGDTRITVLFVDALSVIKPKREMLAALEAEAPDFLAELLALEIPLSTSRLSIPVLDTSDKRIVADMNKTQLEVFIDTFVEPCDGNMIQFDDFCTQFYAWLDDGEIHKWGKITIGRNIPPKYPKGRSTKNAYVSIGNAKWKSDTSATPGGRLVLKKDFLVQAATEASNG